MYRLCEALPESSPSLGWWTKRIHITRFYASSARGTPISLEQMRDALLKLITHCPNLQIFIVDWAMDKHTFGLVADALARSTKVSKSLTTISWHVPCEALPKVIWALGALPALLAASIEFDAPKPDEETENLGAANTITLSLPHLTQLCLNGSHVPTFLEQATGWTLPALRSLSVHSGGDAPDPDLIQFLEAHGAKLQFLDMSCIPSLPLARILSLCPLLTTLAFNADWHIEGGEGDPSPSVPGLTLARVPSPLTIDPHAHIESIGLHGLQHAFGVGYAVTYAEVDPLRSRVIRRWNDLNIAGLEKGAFPKLSRVRVLGRGVLTDLEKAGGPGGGANTGANDAMAGILSLGGGEESGLGRWEAWWDRFYNMGVRLEDCTGAELGWLPGGDTGSDESESDSDEEEDEEEEEEEWEEDEWAYDVEYPDEEVGDHTTELRKLIEECRAMDEERSDDGGVGFPGFGGPSFRGGGGPSYGHSIAFPDMPPPPRIVVTNPEA